MTHAPENTGRSSETEAATAGARAPFTPLLPRILPTHPCRTQRPIHEQKPLPTSHRTAIKPTFKMTPDQELGKITDNRVSGSNSRCAPASCSAQDLSITTATGSSRLHGSEPRDDLPYPTVPLTPPSPHSHMAVYIVLMTRLLGVCRASRRP